MTAPAQPTAAERAALMERLSVDNGSSTYEVEASDLAFAVTFLRASEAHEATIAGLSAALNQLLDVCNSCGEFENGITDPTDTTDEGEYYALRAMHDARSALAASRAALSGDFPPDPRDAEIERLRAENEKLRGPIESDGMVDVFPGDSIVALQADWVRHTRTIARLTADLASANARCEELQKQARAEALEEAAQECFLESGDRDADAQHAFADGQMLDACKCSSRAQTAARCAFRIRALASAPPDAAAHGEET